MANSNSPPVSLDQVVKGAPAPNTSLNTVAAAAFAHPPHDASDRLTPHPLLHTPTDPTSLLPSSPPQIYLNLLILEASLRSQYLTLRARRRQNTFVLTLLGLWILFFTYLLWLRPREDGKGIGGSQYWLLDMLQKVCFMTGLIAALLFWATGQWERGVRWPRRWIGLANRGLRGMNAKVVVIRGPWWNECISWLLFMTPFSGGLWGGDSAGSSYHFINATQEKKHDLSDGRPRHRIIEDGKEYAEEDIASGGDYIKLLLLPKPFTPDFRENWENYRTEYWERENERRAELRKRVRARQREMARAAGGWLWWTGWRGWKRARGIKGGADLERHGHVHGLPNAYPLGPTGSFKERKRRPSALRGRDGSHSRSSSRSTTPTPEVDERLRPLETRERRWSTSTTGSTATNRSDSRRSKKSSTSTAAPGTAQSARQVPVRLAPGSGSRPVTPNETSNPWQSKRASTLSNADNLSGRDAETSGFESLQPVPQTKRRESRDREGNVFPNAPTA